MKNTILSSIALALSIVSLIVSVAAKPQSGVDPSLQKQLDDRFLNVQISAADHRKTQNDAIIKLIQDVEKLKKQTQLSDAKN